MFFSTPIIITAFAASSALAATTTLSNMFIGDSSAGYAGSIVGAGNHLTTVALVCTKGDACASGVTETVTYGSTLFEGSTQTVTAGITASVAAVCSVGGTTIAVCTETITASINGVLVTTTSTATASGSTLFGPITVTAGAEKLSSATITSVSSATSASNSKNAAPTGGLSGMLIGGAALAAGVLL